MDLSAAEEIIVTTHIETFRFVGILIVEIYSSFQIKQRGLLNALCKVAMFCHNII